MGKSITDAISEKLRIEIIDGVYDIDSLLTEIEVSKKFSCSKTPAREALSILCSEGLLEKIPSKGYLIKRYSLKELEDLLQYRNIIERAILEIAINIATESDIKKVEALCDKADALSSEELEKESVLLNREFHIQLASLSKNKYLINAMGNIMDQIRVAMCFDNNQEKLMVGHREILQMIKNRDFEGAYKWAGRFLKHINSRLIGCFSNDM